MSDPHSAFRPPHSAFRISLSAFAIALCLAPCSAQTVPQSRAFATGAELYRSACLACHGPDGKGAPSTVVGFETRIPDFTDCGFATSEPDADWIATVHRGGRARGLDAMMPAFDGALADDEIDRVVEYVRDFCANAAWPRGSLNLPRALLTEKAFPENEAFVTTSVPISYTDRVGTRFAYERRLGARSQYEVVVPFNDIQFPGGWNHGLGDIALAFKHVVLASHTRGSILSGGAELTIPTGKETAGLGNRLAVFEPFGAFSQTLPYEAFVHAQVGVGMPLNITSATNELFWRAAVGRSFVAPRWGRVWSPIVEVLGLRELAFDERNRWDLLPELQVTLSRRQHILASGGVRLPINLRTRGSSVVVSLLWSWSEGGLLAGW
jgi:mono/diheme cytochrome c family protein